MTNEELRNTIADALPHGNKEFLRQIRDGEQDDGPFMQAAFIVRDAISERYALLQASEPVTDE